MGKGLHDYGGGRDIRPPEKRIIDGIDTTTVIELASDLKKAEEAVDHPAHYGGRDNPYEAIKVIEAWGLGFCLGNTIKYISRAGRKYIDNELEDLEKAQWYLARRIEQLRQEKP